MASAAAISSSEAIAAAMYQPAIGRGPKRVSICSRPRALSRSFDAAEPFLPLRALRERNRIEHGRALIAQHRKSAADRAGRFVLAIAARRVKVDAGAGHQRDRPFHRADNLAERDLLGGPGELIAALGPA